MFLVDVFGCGEITTLHFVFFINIHLSQKNLQISRYGRNYLNIALVMEVWMFISNLDNNICNIIYINFFKFGKKSQKKLELLTNKCFKGKF
jgi:hypothetical protein